MALDYFQMTHDHTETENSYTVKLSFNGIGTPELNDITYDPIDRSYTALNILDVPKTVKHIAANALAHLTNYGADHLMKIYQNNANNLVGGGIIKSTHYPPPFNKNKTYVYENDILLGQVYLSQLTIERNAANNYLLSGVIKQIPGATYTFAASPFVALRTGVGNRTAEVLEIRLTQGTKTEESFSGVILNNLFMDEGTPCTVIMHDSLQLDLNKHYKKSGWFFIKD